MSDVLGKLETVRRRLREIVYICLAKKAGGPKEARKAGVESSNPSAIHRRDLRLRPVVAEVSIAVLAPAKLSLCCQCPQLAEYFHK
jgi:hypothetical protein